MYSVGVFLAVFLENKVIRQIPSHIGCFNAILFVVGFLLAQWYPDLEYLHSVFVFEYSLIQVLKYGTQCLN